MVLDVARVHCTYGYIVGGNGDVHIIMAMLAADVILQLVEEDEVVEVIIGITSSDRPSDPRRGDELYEALMSQFPDGQGGVDIVALKCRIQDEMQAALP